MTHWAPAPARGASPAPVPGSPWTATLLIGIGAVGASFVALSAAASNPAVMPVLVVMTASGAVLARRPEWILPSFLALTWTSLGQRFFGGLPSPIEVGALALLVVAVLRVPSVPRVARDVLLIGALVLLPVAASALLSPRGPEVPVERLKDLAFLPIGALLVWSARDVDRVVTALVAVGILLGAGAAWSIAAGPTALFPVTTPVGPFDESPARAAGPFGEPNFFALTLAVLVPLALYLLLRGGWQRGVGAVAVPALFAGILAAGSRGGLLAAGGALVLFGLTSRERGARLGAVALAAAALALVPVFASQAQGSADRSVGGRVTENRVALAMFADHPLVGVGSGSYPYFYRDYTREIGDDPRSFRAAHSLPLQIAAEEGIAGLAGWLAAGLVVLGVAGASGVWRRPLGRALMLSLGAYLVGSLFLHGSLLRLLFVIVGLLLGYAGLLRSERARAEAAA